MRIKKRIRAFLFPKAQKDIEDTLGKFVLIEAESYSRNIGGISESINNKMVKDVILKQKNLQFLSEVSQYIQTAFMPHYEENLFDYYKQQQYLILLNLLSYPFWGAGSLISFIEPYNLASNSINELHILDYGAGIPYGLIYLLKSNPKKIKSITLVDLDLIHTEFVEYILSRLWPTGNIDFIKVRDTDSLPNFGTRRFNFIFGKDVFEHLKEPDRHIRMILENAEKFCYCYLDFNDHGEKYLQHVYPQLLPLHSILEEYSFKYVKRVGKMSEFVSK